MHTSSDLIAATEPEAAHISWAVWPHIDLTKPLDHVDLALPVDDPTLGERLHVHAVVIGLNRSKDDAPAWRMFHTAARHNDHLLAEAFVGTTLEGALMTDLVGIPEGDSAKVTVTRSDVERLANLLRTLGAVDPVYVALGGKVRDGLSRYREELLADDGRGPRIVSLLHYSSRNHGRHFSHPATYRALVHQSMSAAFEAEDWGDWTQPGLFRPSADE